MFTYVLAGIVEKHGGIRVIITAAENVQYHVNEGERAYIVPDFVVEEPIVHYAYLIKRATDYAKSQEDACRSL